MRVMNQVFSKSVYVLYLRALNVQLLTGACGTGRNAFRLIPELLVNDSLERIVVP